MKMGSRFDQAADFIDAIRQVATQLGRPPTRAEMKARANVSTHEILRHFANWGEALRASGHEPNLQRIRIDDAALLEDWGALVRRLGRIPTGDQYRKEGRYSSDVFQKHFGRWKAIPERFRLFSGAKPEWADVAALLPLPSRTANSGPSTASHIVDGTRAANGAVSRPRHGKLDGVPTYGDPIDFRGLRHEPVNEQGVVFLFGMVARELGYLVEAVQTGYPDCEAKRRIGDGKWQRVRVEFEYESRNFREHGHPVNGCDLIVCWRHNWPDCPPELEVVELRTVITRLTKHDGYQLEAG